MSNVRSRTVLAVAFLIHAVFASAAFAVSNTVVISQVYGGAGCGTVNCSTYKNDYIELFNRGTSPVSLNGWSVQYAAATGTSWQVTALPNVTLQPGQYFLVAESFNANGVNSIPTADVTGTIAMSATVAKVALLNITTAQTVACPTGANIIDFIGYGTTANCSETALAPAPSTTTADIRGNGGCTETDNNSTDFTAAAPNPRNTATTFAPCATSTPLGATGSAAPSTLLSGDTTKLTVTVTPATGPASSGITVTGDLTSIGGPASQAFFDNGTNGDTTPGDNVFTFTTTATGSVGTKNIPVAVADAQARNAATNISVNIVTLSAIHNVQGNGDTSPVNGSTVSVRGVVTGVKSNGFFIEEPDAQWDADPNTSEGVFVFTSSAPPAAAAVGNIVTVTATVQEFIPSADTNSPATTELTSPTVSLFSTGNPLPTAVTLTVADTNPAGTLTQMEKYEGMRVHVNTLNVVGPTGGSLTEASATSTSNGTFYGVLPTISRPFREPGIENPDPIPNPPCCIPRFDFNPERIRVASNAIGGAAIDVTAGATVTNLTGPMDYGFRTYTIDPEPATVPVVSGNVTFTAVPTATATEFTVACQNLERFFDDVADGNGATTLTTTAWNNRKNKASLLIRNVLHAPDIMGIEEAETLTGLQSLAAKINADAIAAAQPNPNYTAYLLNGNDVGGINVGVLVNATRVTVNSVTQAAGSASATYTNPNNNTQELIWDRPPLVVDATVIGPPAVPIVVIVNHLRSLSGIDDPTDGNRIRTKRRAGAEWLANYIQGRQTANPNERLVLVGDFNAFDFNDGYVDVMGTLKGVPTPSTNVLLASSDLVNPDLINLSETGTATQRYSYNFDGNAQSIDHILINARAAVNFSRFAHGRVDADFPEIYRNDSTRPERVSDHDGEVVYFSLTPTAHYDVSIPATVTQGTSFSGTVTVRDGLNNVYTSYNGTVHFTSSDGLAVLPSDYTFTGGDAGVHTFNFTLQTAGSQSITGTDTLSPAITGTANTTVTCPSVSVTATNSGPICQGGTLQLDVTDVSGATYAWTGPNTFSSSQRNPSISGATTAASGLYSVTVTVNGCNYNSNTTAQVDAMPTTPTISADTNGTGTQDQACPEVPLTLHANATGATSYQWYKDIDLLPGETASTYQATGAATYYVTATNGACTTVQSAGYVVQNPTPHSPFISFRGQDSSVTSISFCQGGSIIIDSDSATGIQWYKDGLAIPGPQTQSITVSASGVYTAQLNALGCHSQFGRNVTVTVNPLPATPTITPGGSTTFCAGGSVTLTSSAASGNQWLLNGSPIGGATNTSYIANANGNYSVTVTDGNGCSATSSATTVTVNPLPATPTVTPGGPTTFCAGGSVTLTSSAASGNQWLLNGNPIGGATNTTYIAGASGNYSVMVTDGNGCSATSAATTVTANPLPTTPTITPGGPTAFCQGGTVTLNSSAASGNQWYFNNAPINGATGTSYIASAAGGYYVTVTDGNGCSASSTPVSVTVFPLPATPTITPGGPTTFCQGGSVTLTSSAASGNQWLLNGSPIGGATNTTYNATASGNYSVTVTDGNGCSATSAATTVTVNPIPSTPTITPGGPTTFCAGGSVTLNSSSASGNQWYLNGSPIGGATAASYIANASGDYTVVVTTSGCSSAASAVTTVTVNPIPNATITAPSSVQTLSTGNAASVANAGVGASYNWSITNGTITGGTGTNSITFTAGVAGTLTLQVTVTASGCSDTKSANVSVTTPPPSLTITSVTPPAGKTTGGRSVTIAGTGFQNGATVTFGGSAATNVVVVNSTQITAKTPAHAGGAVNVTVTNPNTQSATLTNGYTYVPQQFDANGDHTIDPSDIFYLVNYLFLNGPAPIGDSGMLSGDANDDGVVDPADIFYLVNYLYLHGPAPASQPGRVTTSAAAPEVSGSISLGEPVRRNGKLFVPVLVNAENAEALSLRLTFDSGVHGATIHRVGKTQPAFEISRASDNALAYLVVYDRPFSGVIAELELDGAANGRIEVDAAATLLSNAAGTRKATVTNGTLRVNGTEIGRAGVREMGKN